MTRADGEHLFRRQGAVADAGQQESVQTLVVTNYGLGTIVIAGTLFTTLNCPIVTVPPTAADHRATALRTP